MASDGQRGAAAVFRLGVSSGPGDHFRETKMRLVLMLEREGTSFVLKGLLKNKDLYNC